MAATTSIRREIEALALRHAGVARPPRSRWPTSVSASASASPSSREAEPPTPLLDHLAAEGLSKYDMPEYFVALEAFPLTASGKILKRELITMARRGEIMPTPIRYVEKKEASA